MSNMLLEPAARLPYNLQELRSRTQWGWRFFLLGFDLGLGLREAPETALATSRSPAAPAYSGIRQPSSILQISSGQSELMEHRAEKAGADFLSAVLQRREPVAVIESPMTTLVGATIIGDSHPAVATEPSDTSFKLVAGHVLKDRTYLCELQGVTTAVPAS